MEDTQSNQMTERHEVSHATFLSKEKLFDLLITERNYHSDHPQEINSKFLYALSGALATMFISIAFKEDLIIEFTKFSDFYKKLFVGSIGVILIGFVLIGIGLLIHLKHHRNKRKNVEIILNEHILLDSSQLNNIFPVKGHKYKLKEILETNDIPKLSEKEWASYIFTREPNYKTGFSFHDFWIILGGGTAIIGYISFFLIILIS